MIILTFIRIIFSKNHVGIVRQLLDRTALNNHWQYGLERRLLLLWVLITLY